MFKPVIKWSGSKRSQVNEILKYFPKEIDTYYEPFCGGASVLRGLLDSDIKVNSYVCSDISKPLIDLWNEIKNNPKELCDYYENEREKFVKDKGYYYEVRKRFNQNEDCKDFYNVSLFTSETNQNLNKTFVSVFGEITNTEDEEQSTKKNKHQFRSHRFKKDFHKNMLYKRHYQIFSSLNKNYHKHHMLKI